VEPRDRRLLKAIAISTTFIACMIGLWLLVFVLVLIAH
jgi:hypothetical protein